MISAERVLYNKKLEAIPKRGLGNRVIRYFPDTHLGNGHDGLAKIAEKNGINVKDLAWGEFVIFTNRKKTALKLYSQGNLVAHLRMPGEQRMDLRVISLIPRFFNGSSINYSAAIGEVLRKELGK